jgi:hypothetical protein
MVYSCRSRSCKAEFVTERGLSSHRINCIHYKRHEAAALLRRKDLAQKLRAKRSEGLAKVRTEVEKKRKQVSYSL